MLKLPVLLLSPHIQRPIFSNGGISLHLIMHIRKLRRLAEAALYMAGTIIRWASCLGRGKQKGPGLSPSTREKPN